MHTTIMAYSSPKGYGTKLNLVNSNEQGYAEYFKKRKDARWYSGNGKFGSDSLDVINVIFSDLSKIFCDLKILNYLKLKLPKSLTELDNFKLLQNKSSVSLK